jgi:hypothetical protein
MKSESIENSLRGECRRIRIELFLRKLPGFEKHLQALGAYVANKVRTLHGFLRPRRYYATEDSQEDASTACPLHFSPRSWATPRDRSGQGRIHTANYLTFDRGES